MTVRQHLQHLVSAEGGYERICARDGGNYVLGHAQSQHFRDSFDLVVLCSEQGLLIHPLHVLPVVIIAHFILALFVPLYLQHILDAMLCGAGSRSDCAVVGLCLALFLVSHAALIAAAMEGLNQQRLALEPFSRTVDVNTAAFVFRRQVQLKSHEVQVPARLNVVQSPNYHHELPEPLEIELLQSAFVSNYCDSGATSHHELGYYICLVPPHVPLAKQKLPVEICQVDCIHIYQMDQTDPRQR